MVPIRPPWLGRFGRSRTLAYWPSLLHQEELVVVLLRPEAHELAAMGVGERHSRVWVEPKRIDGLEAVALVLHAVLPFPFRPHRELDPEDGERTWSWAPRPAGGWHPAPS